MANLRRLMQPDIRNVEGSSQGLSDLTQEPSQEAPDIGGLGGAKSGDKSQSSTRPRENFPPPGGGGGGMITSAPRTPSAPTPAAGMGSLVPFQPMSGPNPASLATPNLRGLYGSQGGLKGGGLGVPLDPQSNDTSDPISGLLDLLTKLQGQ